MNENVHVVGRFRPCSASEALSSVGRVFRRDPIKIINNTISVSSVSENTPRVENIERSRKKLIALFWGFAGWISPTKFQLGQSVSSGCDPGVLPSLVFIAVYFEGCYKDCKLRTIIFRRMSRPASV